MKNIAFSLFFGCLFSAFALSCKHDPVDGGIAAGGNTGGSTCSADTVYFQQQVLPILTSNCAKSGCHDAASRQDGVDLTSYAKIITTADVRPGQPGSSKLWKVITETDPSKRMPRPPAAPLSQAQKDAVFKWISQGARNNFCQASACDTAAVTFSGKIKPILDNKCLGCHGGTAPQGGINLSTHAGVKAKVTDGRLWGAVNHLSGFSPMPKGNPQQKLSECEIRQIKIWMDAGTPNN